MLILQFIPEKIASINIREYGTAQVALVERGAIFLTHHGWKTGKHGSM